MMESRFVDFDGKLRIAVRKQLCQFCIIKPVLKNTCRESFRVVFPFGLGPTGMPGDGVLADLGFPGIIAEQFRLVKVIKEGDLLHLIQLFGLTAEGTLVHQCDLLSEEVQLAAYSIQLSLKGTDDGDEDLLVHLVQLFGGKLSKIHRICPLLNGMIIP